MIRAPKVGEYVYVLGRLIGEVDRARGYDALTRCALIRFANGTAQYISWEDLTHATRGLEAWIIAKAIERRRRILAGAERAGRRRWWGKGEP